MLIKQVDKSGYRYNIADGYDWFWKMFGDGTWEPGTFKVFDKFLDPEKVFVDIGAWIGPMTLYAANRSKQVVAFEPDPIAFHSLKKNIELNHLKNVVAYPVAVSNEWKLLNFGARNSFGDSMASELWGDKEEVIKVPSVSLGSILAPLSPNFIKIDIEGGEKTIFQDAHLALDYYGPTIHLSLHTPWFENIEEYKESIISGIGLYPYFYDENLDPVKLEEMFDPEAFNSVVASFKKL